jgi:hypothetical protein
MASSGRMKSASPWPGADAIRSDDLPLGPANVVRKDKSRPLVLVNLRSQRWASRSARPMTSFRERKPICARPAHSSATKWKKFTRSSGAPAKRAQFFTLGGHTHRAVVGVADTGHDAASGNHSNCTEPRLISSQHGTNLDVTCGRQAIQTNNVKADSTFQQPVFVSF